MTDATSGIRNERILFQPAEDQAREEITEFTTSSQRVLIGRKLAGGEDAQATPVYLLKMDVGDRIGRTEVTVKIKRQHATKDEEEMLEVESVTGWSPAKTPCWATTSTSPGAPWPTSATISTPAGWTTSNWGLFVRRYVRHGNVAVQCASAHGSASNRSSGCRCGKLNFDIGRNVHCTEHSVIQSAAP